MLCEDNDDKKSALERKIDLLLNASSMEISSSEWKKDGLTEQQQIKNVRTNSAILRELLKLPIHQKKKNDLFVLGWIGLVSFWNFIPSKNSLFNRTIGLCGYVFAVRETNDVHVAYHVGDLILPASLSSFEDFQKTLDTLISFKNHQLRLKRIIKPAYNKQSASNTLRSFRSVTPPPNQQSTPPNTFFTPVKKQ